MEGEPIYAHTDDEVRSCGVDPKTRKITPEMFALCKKVAAIRDDKTVWTGLTDRQKSIVFAAGDWPCKDPDFVFVSDAFLPPNVHALDDVLKVVTSIKLKERIKKRVQLRQKPDAPYPVTSSFDGSRGWR